MDVMILHGKKSFLIIIPSTLKNIMMMLTVVMEIMFIHEGKKK